MKQANGEVFGVVSLLAWFVFMNLDQADFDRFGEAKGPFPAASDLVNKLVWGWMLPRDWEPFFRSLVGVNGGVWRTPAGRWGCIGFLPFPLLCLGVGIPKPHHLLSAALVCGFMSATTILESIWFVQRCSPTLSTRHEYLREYFYKLGLASFI